MILSRKKTLSLVFLISSFLISNAQVDSVGTKKIKININGSTLKIPYFSNLSLEISDNAVAQAIIIVHGSSRNAHDHYENMRTAASMRAPETDSVIIVAPQFLTEDDLDAFNLDNEHLYWSNGGWKSGSISRNSAINHPRLERVSSYAVLDSIMLTLTQNFPNLKSIIFTGHSAGGQLTNRYAATTRVVDLLCNQYEVSTKFIVANPSSYVYMDSNRIVPGTIDQFEIPNTSCTEYNDWRYGLDNLYSYPSSVGKDSIRVMLKRRETIYILGENDNNPNSSSLGISCKSMLQGNHRLERGSIYFNYLINYYGNDILNFHSFDTIPGAGHSNFDMYTSNKGLYHLFESYPTSCKNTLSTALPNNKQTFFSVYPNPTSGLLEINLTDNNASILLFNITGKIINRFDFINAQHQQTIDIRDLKNGIYILQYLSDDYQITKKIIKK